MSDIYREIVIDHYKNPRNKGSLEGADKKGKEDNVVCGDTIEYFLQFDNNKVKAVRWEGQGCALSQASASLLSEKMIGKSTEELETISEKDVLELVGGDLNPSRQKCATLSLLALKQAIRR